jgi:peptide/nickel transport system substrate-binding protein
LRTLWQDVEADVVNELTIQFRLPDPFTPFMDYLTFGILPAHLWQGLTAEQLIANPSNMQPVGSGPYRFERLLVEDGQIAGVVLAANDAYFDGRPFIDQLVLRYYPDSVAALAAYQAGEIQGISQITAQALPGALKEPNLNFYTSRLPEQAIIFLNLDNPDLPFFQDTAVRRALLMGLNRQRMIDRVFGGQAAIADGPIFPNTWAYYENIERVPYDPDQAIKMLKAAGYTIPASGGNVRANDQDQRLIFTLVYPDSAQHTALAEMIKADWEVLGVGVILKALPYETLISDYLETRLYQAALVDLSLSRTPDPDPYPFWHQTQASNGQNYSMWNDRQASEYLEQARIIQDLAERTRLYRNFQVRFTNELPAVPLFYPMYTYGVDAAVRGVRLGPLFDLSDRFSHVREWYLFSQQTLDVNATSTAAP